MENNNINQPSIDAAERPESKKHKNKFTYKKRSGTSGVTGQLYETKLLSLILYRALSDEDIEEFYLGNNLDDIGAFDDICLKFKLNNEYVAAFIQAKHRDDPRKGGITDADLTNKKGDFNIRTYFDSFLKIKRKFDNINSHNDRKNIDKMFTEQFKDIKCYFIIYTPAVGKITKKKYIDSKTHVNKVRELISTRLDEDIFQIAYDDNVVSLLANSLIEEQLNLIAKALLDCTVIDNKEYNQSNERNHIIEKYRHFLIPNVIEIPQEGTEESYEGRINPKLLFSNSFEYIKLRELMIENILNVTKCDESKIETKILSLLYSNVDSLKTLSEVIGTIVIYNAKTNTLDLADTMPDTFEKYRTRLNETPISQAKVAEAYYEAGKEKLLSIRFNLPKTLRTAQPISMTTNTEYETFNTSTINYHIQDRDIFGEEKSIARQFLNQLFFYTKEAKQNEVEIVLKKELHKCKENDLSTAHIESVYLKIHDKIQKWSMLQGNVFYLTNVCDFIETSRREVIGTPHLTTLNFKSTYEEKKYSIEFKDEIVNKLHFNNLPNGVSTIITNNKTLTCMKLFRCLKNVICTFVDIKYIANASIDMGILLQEIKSTQLDALVMICEYIQDDIVGIISRITECYQNKLLIVTDQKSTAEIKTEIETNVIFDMDNNLIDLFEETQKQLLECNKIIVQGLEVPLNSVINNENKHLIRGEILLKLMNNENIVVGKDLTDEKYDSIKDYYLPRSLSFIKQSRYDDSSRFEYKVNNFYDILNSIVVLTAEPGMGKSTLMTHLSLETKIIFPNVWILRINLLDHCSVFMKWQEERCKINLKDTMTLVCKSELDHIEGNFDLEDTDGVITLKNCDMKGVSLLNLEYIIHSYNNGTIVFIFDGFDEICPHYEKEAITLIKNVIPGRTTKNSLPLTDDTDDDDGDTNNIIGYLRYSDDEYETNSNDFSMMQNKMDNNISDKTKNKYERKIWITSRPYNAIKNTLEYKFVRSHQMEPLSVYDQDIFYDKYLEANVKLNELSAEQFRNIEEFFEYMSQFRRKYRQDFKVLHITSVPLHSMYEIVVDYFRNAVLHSPLNVDKEKLRNEWVSRKELLLVLERCVGDLYELSRAGKLSRIPLHMHIAVNYFINKIKSTEPKKAHNKWDVDVNTFAYFESFLETKFKTIRLEEKNRRYTSCPDERLAYEREKIDFIENHKKLALFALFHKHSRFRQLISKRSYSQVKEMIKKIEKGEEKTGLIHRIHNKIPRFIHLVFAEYFAFEYIADKLKVAKHNGKKKIIDFILNYLLLDGSMGVMTVFDHKLIHDEELRNALTDSESKRYVFQLLMEQNDMTEEDYVSDSGIFYEKKIKTSIVKVLENGLSNIVMFLLSSLEGNLNGDNLKTFVELIGKHFFVSAALDSHDDIILYTLNQIRNIDATIVCDVIRSSELPYYFRPNSDGELPSNEELLTKSHAHAQRMVTPYWYYDDEIHEFRCTYIND